MVVNINDAIIRSFQSLYDAESFGICSLHTIYTLKDLQILGIQMFTERNLMPLFLKNCIFISRTSQTSTGKQDYRVTEASLLPHPDLAIHSWAKTKIN